MKIGLLRALKGLVLLVLLIMAFLAMPAWAAVQQPNYFIQDTNAFNPLLLTNNQTVTFTPGGTTSRQHTIRQGKGLTLFLETVQTNSVASTTTNYITKFDISVDGTNFTTGVPAQPIVWTISFIGGASTNRFFTNLPPTVASNFREIQCTSASTTASNNVTSKLWYSQDNQ